MEITLGAVERANDAFVTDWNAGNIEAACQLYADDARYITNKGLVVGRQEITKMYTEGIQDDQTMGQLSLNIIDFELPPSTNGKIALVISRWTLHNQGKTSQGFVAEVFELVRGELRITQDASM